MTRTLLASGFTITDVQRHPGRIEFRCSRLDPFGVELPYCFIFNENEEGAENIRDVTLNRAQAERRLLVLVSPAGSRTSIAWPAFVSPLGGAVPSWRALTSEFPSLCRTLARNELPPGLTGTPFDLFEEAVADSFEFAFGRRVLRLGARLPGRPVSDMVTQTPDGRVLILDAKASADPFSVGAPQLRPLREYVDRQRVRQQGGDALRAAILVAYSFQQDEERLHELSREFNVDTGIPLSFLELETMLTIVDRVSHAPRLRNTIRWAHLLCGGGRVSPSEFEAELRASEQEAYR